jgi:hypothetical protein
LQATGRFFATRKIEQEKGEQMSGRHPKKRHKIKTSSVSQNACDLLFHYFPVHRFSFQLSPLSFQLQLFRMNFRHIKLQQNYR